MYSCIHRYQEVVMIAHNNDHERSLWTDEQNRFNVNSVILCMKAKLLVG